MGYYNKGRQKCSSYMSNAQNPHETNKLHYLQEKNR